jgi:hypothetical protein
MGLVFMCGAASWLSAAGSAGTQVVAATAPAATGAKATASTAPGAAAKLAAQRAAAKAAAAVAAMKLLAPADEYFGPLKQSVIGMRNQIRILGWNYDVNHDIAHQTYVSASLTERAVRDWSGKYPHDGQIPRTLFLLQRLYTKILSQESRDHAHMIAQWLFVSYAKSPQAKQLQKTLAVEHLAALPTPTPAATPTYQTVFGSAYPSQFNATAPPSAAVPAPASSP